MSALRLIQIRLDPFIPNFVYFCTKRRKGDSDEMAEYIQRTFTKGEIKETTKEFPLGAEESPRDGEM